MTGRQKVNKRRQNPKRRAREKREGAVRLAQRAMPTLLILAIIVGLPFLSYHAYQFAVTSPSFAIAEIEITGAEHVTSKQLMEVGQISPGVNIFDVDEERVERALTTHEWIAHARVLTKLPGTLQIEIEEHEPVALLVDEGAYHLLDASGRPFREVVASELTEELFDAMPLLSGLDRVGLSQESGGERERLFEAMKVWEMWHERGLEEIAPISEVHLDDVLGLSLIVGAQGTEVRFGWGDWEARLERFAVVYQDLLDRGVAVDYMLVDQDGATIDRVAVGPTRAMD